MHERVDRIARAITAENGKTLAESRMEIHSAIKEMEFQISEGLYRLGEVMPSGQDGVLAYSIRRPLGVVAVIAPWNFPFNVPVRKCIPALIAGSFFESQLLVLIGVIAYVGALLLQFLTLPVEFNASKRALAQLESLHLMNEQEKEGAQKVLRAAAMTYVAGVASAAGYIVYLALVGGRLLLKKPPVVPPTGPPVGPTGV